MVVFETISTLDSRVNPNTEVLYGATDGVDREAYHADGALSPHRIEPATVLVDIKAWPGNVSVFGKVGCLLQPAERYEPFYKP